MKKIAASTSVETLTRKLRSLALIAWRNAERLFRLIRIKMLCNHVIVPWSATIGRNVFLQATDGGSIHIGARTTISTGVQIVAQEGAIAIGSDSFIGIGCVVVCKAGIEIGDDVLIAEYVTIRDQDHRYPAGMKMKEAGFECAPIAIGNDVWIAAKSSVLKGSRIGAGAVVGAHSLVKGNVSEDSIVMGTPARLVRKRPHAG